MKLFILPLFVGLLFYGQAYGAANKQGSQIQQKYFDSLSELCGQAFKGEVTEDNRNDKNFSDKEIILHILTCSNTKIKLALHVGDNHSRVLSLSKIKHGLQLSHDHRHKNGLPDKLTLYGGKTINLGTISRQEFYVDATTKDIFIKNGLQESLLNVWTITKESEHKIIYRLSRPNRQFQIDFDLQAPVLNPPKAWGY